MNFSISSCNLRLFLSFPFSLSSPHPLPIPPQRKKQSVGLRATITFIARVQRILTTIRALDRSQKQQSFSVKNTTITPASNKDHLSHNQSNPSWCDDLRCQKR
ncbi:uncharacterized protein BO96DRAFT_120818 [Aspergillus niger CBS 101883]|uniref:uncharacterized protein n=1 Tax=Aspergillus lacticoffeatus (strain CBS 101883) TaxID=1450533 RepID=UPI000D7FAAC3|nr:uncharacterized protein BO96DRAFT_120818 [Aspergillus niger CBS 101883]PYH53864.1 hypothetical protein BO96DRAFT_120818 [Aspergillus niger CBS 101883]